MSNHFSAANLKHPRADARLDLQQVLHRIYDAAGYGFHIYSGKPEPPLPPEQATWAQQFLQATAQPA